MTETIGIRRWSLAIAGLASLLCIGNGIAQVQRPASREGAKVQLLTAPDSSNADAAAYAKLNSGQVDEAVTAFQAILAAQPKDAAALAGMGQARMLQGNYLGAVSFLEKAKQANPNDAAIGAALDGARFQFLMGEGKDAQTAKDFVDAEKRYREALELRPDARQAIDALVNVLVLENKLSDAQDTLSTAVAEGMSSGHPPTDIELELAQLDIANNQPQLAYPIFLQVLQDSPKRTDAWSGLISALHLMGHDADAVAQEKVVPAETRTQLEATPGFQQMMTAIAAAPAQPVVAGASSYTPFVTAAVPPVPVMVSPAPAPSAAAASVPPSTAQRIVANPQRAQAPVSGAAVKTNVAKPLTAPTAPKAVAAARAQTSRVPAVAERTVPPSRPSNNMGSGAPLVTQPATKPASHGEEVPDTGEQQYPQPKMRPRAASAN